MASVTIGSPAHAGIDRLVTLATRLVGVRFPRTRGDRPNPLPEMDGIAQVPPVPPHTRG